MISTRTIVAGCPTIPAPFLDATVEHTGWALAAAYPPHPHTLGRCLHVRCVESAGYRCPTRRQADLLSAASTARWPQFWQARLDALSCGIDPRSTTPPDSRAARPDTPRRRAS